jgi:hypothetical protein
MKKSLNEFSTGYPSSIGNSQSQEYGGVFGPVDAETVQGHDRLDARTAEGLHRLNAFISQFFKRTTLNPKNEILQLKVRLNHLNLDFPYTNQTEVSDVNNFVVTQGGNAFGVTPTTDLSQGFDTGSDLPQYNLEIRIIKLDGSYKMEGRLTPLNQVAESKIQSSLRESRIKNLKKIMDDKKMKNMKVKKNQMKK